jgi:hypothetical protein
MMTIPIIRNQLRHSSEFCNEALDSGLVPLQPNSGDRQSIRVPDIYRGDFQYDSLGTAIQRTALLSDQTRIDKLARRTTKCALNSLCESAEIRLPVGTLSAALPQETAQDFRERIDHLADQSVRVERNDDWVLTVADSKE